MLKKTMQMVRWIFDSFFISKSCSGDLASLMKLWFIATFAFIDFKKNRLRRLIRLFFGMFLTSAKGKEIHVALKINERKFRVKFGNRSPTEFWSIRSILIEVLIKESYKIELHNPVQTIIDAGANTGIASLYFTSLHPNATVYCYEPSTETFDLLQWNLQQNQVKFFAFRKALYDEECDAYFDRLRSSMERSILFSNAVPSDNAGERVQTVTLAGEFDRLGLNRIDLIKFDIEGAEALMLRGLGTKINRVRAFIGEVHDERLSIEVKNIFLENGYKVQWRQGHILATK